MRRLSGRSVGKGSTPLLAPRDPHVEDLTVLGCSAVRKPTKKRAGVEPQGWALRRKFELGKALPIARMGRDDVMAGERDILVARPRPRRVDARGEGARRLGQDELLAWIEREPNLVGGVYAEAFELVAVRGRSPEHERCIRGDEALLAIVFNAPVEEPRASERACRPCRA